MLCVEALYWQWLLALLQFLSLVYLCPKFFFFCKCSRFFPFSCDFSWLFVNFIIFFVSKLFIIVACSLKDFFHAIFTSVYIMLIFLPSNDHMIDTEFPQGMCSATFVVDDFSKLFLQLYILLIKISGSA